MTIYKIKSTTIQDLIDNLYEVDDILERVKATGSEYKRSLEVNKNDKNDYEVEFKLWKEKN